MLLDAVEGQAEWFRELTDGGGMNREQLEDPAACRIREGEERPIEGWRIVHRSAHYTGATWTLILPTGASLTTLSPGLGRPERVAAASRREGPGLKERKRSRSSEEELNAEEVQ